MDDSGFQILGFQISDLRSDQRNEFKGLEMGFPVAKLDPME